MNEHIQLEVQIPKLDSAKQPSVQLHSKISALKYKLNKLLSDKISRACLANLEFGDKLHKLLARHLRKRESGRGQTQVRLRVLD